MHARTDIPKRGFAPGSALAPYIDRYYAFSRPDRHGGLCRVPPGAAIDLVFVLGGTVDNVTEGGRSSRIKAGSLIGVATGPVDVRLSEGCELFMARFKRGEAYPFLGRPACELTDDAVPVQHVWGREGGELVEQVAEARGPLERARRVEEFLLRRLASSAQAGEPRVREAVAAIQASDGGVSNGELERRAGVSEQHLNRCLKTWVGAGSKYLRKVVRFQKVLDGFQAGGRPDWSDFAVDHGYFDQSHFINEFRRFVGDSPARFASTARLPLLTFGRG